MATSRRKAAPVENAEYLAMMRRMVRAAGRRLGSHTDDLAGLAQLSADVDQALADAVATARADGASWAEIGSLLGISRQGAQQRFSRG